MDNLLKLFSTNPPAALILSLALLGIVLTVLILCAVAFAQGRSISFWPPAIGERPGAKLESGSEARGDKVLVESAPAEYSPSNPVVDRGAILQGSSGSVYRILSSVYGGANATLFKAHDQQGNAVIAKVYWRGLIPNSPPWELFKQEQRAAEILNHRNIVRMLDRGLRMGYPFTIVEYMGGGTLRDWLRTHDRMPGHDINSIAFQLADAIDYAHSRGVIHRDIKPGNILFESDPNGRVALSDFGIAAILGAAQRDITAAGGEFSGSPGYLAPELILGVPSNRASDIYSFGVVVYEMIANTLPFDEYQSPLATINAKVNHDAPNIQQFRPDVPEGIAASLARMIARDPAQRPNSAREALAEIGSWLMTVSV
jgi:serine/threonine-protein kinase